MTGPSYLIEVRKVNLDTNEKEVLFKREGSGYLFADWFDYKDYKIQLRFQLKEITAYAHKPVLKVDIKDKTTGKDKPTSKKTKWHHIPSKYDDQTDKWIYDFEYEGLRLLIYIIRDMRKSFTGDCITTR